MPAKSLFLLLSLLFSTAALAQTADLTITANPYDQKPARLSVLFAMTNQGPDVARDAVLTIDVPAGVTVDRFSYGAGDVIKQCDTTQRPMRCSVGDMHVGMPFHYGSIDLRTTLEQATYVLTMTLTSGTPDPNAANNVATVTWEAVIEADLTTRVEYGGGRANPGGVADFAAMVCNNVRESLPPAVDVEITATNGTIRGITPAAGFTCTAETPSKSVCRTAELPDGCVSSPFLVSVAVSEDRRGGETTLTMDATSNLREVNPSNNRDTAVITVYRWLTVNTTADAGPGSLRDAIDEANAGCTPDPCSIVFEIPGPVPAEGWFTITPSTPLPPIAAARVTLEGSRQTAFTGNSNTKGPEIAIDGRLAGQGLKMLTLCEGLVEGLAIGNFHEDQGLWISTGADCRTHLDRREVVDNYIGVDPTGEVAWPNRRGLRADFANGLTVSRNLIRANRHSGIWLWRGAATIVRNRIEDNGSSGVFLGPEVFAAVVSDNVIRGNREMGVAAAHAVNSLGARRNQMQDNGGLPIDWGLDGVSTFTGDHGPTNAPLLLSARYDAARNQTTINVTLRSLPLGSRYNYGYLDFFANAKPDGDGESYIGSSGQIFQFEGTTTVSLPGDYRGRWINATWTREHLPYGTSPRTGTQSHEIGFMVMTSEYSNTVLVE